MNINDLMREHCNATLQLNTVNSNGTAWFCSDGNLCNEGADYRVLVEDRTPWEFPAGVRLGDLQLQSDLLEVQLDGVTIY